ncbi:MAG: DoxX family membrane protein, partial [Bacteroidota bacterium]
MKIIVWIARLVAAFIMVQTLYFKFTGAPESVEIFTTVGMEPWGRIGVGVMELIASVLILIPAVSWWGA